MCGRILVSDDHIPTKRTEIRIVRFVYVSCVDGGFMGIAVCQSVIEEANAFDHRNCALETSFPKNVVILSRERQMGFWIFTPVSEGSLKM